MSSRAEDWGQQWGVTGLTLVTKTAIAEIWRGRRGTVPVALKLWHAGIALDERAAVDLLAAWGPDLAPQILERRDDALLMSWLEGPLLGTLPRTGRDAEATRMLADLARSIQSRPLSKLPELMPLETRCAALLSLAPEAPAAFHAARRLLKHLLDSSPPPVPLHGDLHHDNVILTPLGPRVIDAKGLWGDPTYELANAFRNPVGFSPQQVTADLSRARAQVWALALDTTSDRMLQWAAAKCALSILWRGAKPDDRDLPLLDLFLDLTV